MSGVCAGGHDRGLRSFDSMGWAVLGERAHPDGEGLHTRQETPWKAVLPVGQVRMLDTRRIRLCRRHCRLYPAMPEAVPDTFEDNEGG
jgi:hypothetical protein